jgi:hypothetical protein
MSKRPCVCDRCAIGKPFASGDCYNCWLFHNNPAYRNWGMQESALPARDLMKCPHHGPTVKVDGKTKTRACTTCGGKKLEALVVFECRHPSRAGRVEVSVRDCQGCGLPW